MGIDAEMYVVNTGPILSDESIRNLSHTLCRVCGSELFLTSHPGEYGAHPDGQHVLEEPTTEELKYIELPDQPKGQLLAVNLTGRYYGEGYERGRLRNYVWVAEVLECLIPGCAIYYGGDSSDIKERFDKSRRDALIDHLLSLGGNAYYSAWDTLTRSSTAPTCDLCAVPMMCNGGGPGGISFYWCWCGLRVETRDGGKTFVERDKKGGKNRAWPFTLRGINGE